MIAASGRPTKSLYYGWVLAAVLGCTTVFAYGGTQYLFGVLVTPIGQELHWSRASVSAAYAIALLISGVLGLPVGRIVDRRGGRLVLAAGSVFCGVSLVGLSFVYELWQFYLVWAAIGLSMSLTLYSVTLVVINQWFVRKRGAALALITTLGGLASPIFIPIAGVLTSRYGWRETVLLIGIAQLLVPFPAHAFAVRRRPEDLGQRIDGDPVDSPRTRFTWVARFAGDTLLQALRSPAFWLLALALGLTSLAVSTVQAHLIAFLIAGGYTPTIAAFAAGAIGLASLPGRVVLNLVTDRFGSRPVLIACYVTMAVGVVALVVSSAAITVVAFVVLYGVPFGAVSPLRASVIADQFGRAAYGTILAAQGLTAAVCGASGPLIAGWLYDHLGSYQLAFALTAIAMVIAAVNIAMTPRSRLVEAAAKT